jgi:hypothetical protein
VVRVIPGEQWERYGNGRPPKRPGCLFVAAIVAALFWWVTR